MSRYYDLQIDKIKLTKLIKRNKNCLLNFWITFLQFEILKFKKKKPLCQGFVKAKLFQQPQKNIKQRPTMTTTTITKQNRSSEYLTTKVFSKYKQK